MNRSRVTGDLASHGNIFVDIANDRVGIGSTIPDQKLSLPDNARIALGNSADLQLYHNTSDYIQSSSQYFYIGGENVVLTNAAANEITLKAIQNGAVELYYDNTKRFETTSTGAQVTGNLNVTGVLTYDDVTNIDSLGIVTARTGVDVNAGGINVDGGGLNIVGVSTFANNIDANGDLDVDGHTELDLSLIHI